MRFRAQRIIVAALSGVLLLGTLTDCAPVPRARRDPGPFLPSRTDFNGDGYADVAISATGTTVGGRKNAGAVVIAYGGPHGLDRAHRTVLTPDSPGILGAPRTDGAFGYRTTTGDLDRDGYTDLVVAAKEPSVRVIVVWGSAEGLTGGTAVPRPAGDPVDDEHRTVFGKALAIGDFDGDHTPELAIGTSDSGLERQRVWVYGGGITRAGAVREPYLRKVYAGYSVVWGASAGDLNGDGTTDLVVRTYLTDSPGGGYYNIFYPGSSRGLAEGRNLKYRSLRGADGKSRPRGEFFGDIHGDSQAIGDVNGDGYNDLAVGENSGGWGGRGCVTVVYGSPKGFGKGHADQVLDGESPGVPGFSKGPLGSEDGFGTAVALGDIDGDGYADLAIGIPGEYILQGRKDATIPHPGAVTVLRGSAKGLTTTGAQSFTQDTPGLPGGDDTDHIGELFGSATALTDIDKDGKADLVVSASGADSGGGAVWTLRGTADGLTTTGALRLGPTDLGLPGQDTGLGSAFAG